MSFLKRSHYDKSLWQRFLETVSPKRTTAETRLPEKSVLEYLESSYPPNHNYVLEQGELIALRKLARRYAEISTHYPANMDSLLDTSCSKGFFNFDAVRSYGCTRSMGIDVMENELQACAAVKAYLAEEVTNFEQLRLHELAGRVDEFGGPFDAVLVINCYQYLYFGSSRFPGAYMSHDRIFRDLRTVCKNRLIFSNRLEVDRLQDYPAEKAKGPDMNEAYDEATVFAAASKYFTVERAGKLGRYPLWTLDVKPV